MRGNCTITGMESATQRETIDSTPAEQGIRSSPDDPSPSLRMGLGIPRTSDVLFFFFQKRDGAAHHTTPRRELHWDRREQTQTSIAQPRHDQNLGSTLLDKNENCRTWKGRAPQRRNSTQRHEACCDTTSTKKPARTWSSRETMLCLSLHNITLQINLNITSATRDA